MIVDWNWFTCYSQSSNTSNNVPTIARFFIKTALLHLLLGLLLGLVWSHPAVVHLITVGWLTQLIFGVAFWLFPRVSKESAYGTIRPVWAAYGLLNGGLLLRLLAEPASLQYGAESVWSVLLSISAVFQWVASVLLVLYFWKRVRTK